MNYSRSLPKTLAAIFAALLLLPAAAAAYPLKGGALETGKTTFTFDRTLRRAMDAAGVEALPLAPAKKVGKAAIRLQVSEGMFEPRFGSGYAFQRGGILLRAGGRSVALRRLVLNTGKKRLAGAVAGHAITIAKVDEVKGWRTDFGLAVRVKSLRLTEKAAEIISARLRLDGIFRTGRALGLAHLSGTLFTVPITGGTIDFVLDEAFRQKLDSLGVAVSTTGTATQTGSAPLAFHLSEVKGDVDRRLAHGGIGTTDDGLKFVQAASPLPKEVTWASLGLNFENGFGGEGSDVALARWTGVGAVGPIGQIEFGSDSGFDSRLGTLTRGLVSATLSPFAAAPLNEAFGGGKEVFKGGEPLGSFAFAVSLR